MKPNLDWKEGDWPADKVLYEVGDKVLIGAREQAIHGTVKGETYVRGYRDYVVEMLNGKETIVNAMLLSLASTE